MLEIWIGGAALRKVIRVILAFLLLLAFGAAVWFGVGALFDLIKGFGKEAVTASITALFGLFGILYAQWHSKAKEISDSHRPAKIEVYETFFDIVERFMTEEKAAEFDPEGDEFPDDFREQFMKLSRGMIIWASPQVIRAWSGFRENSGTGSAKDTLLAVDAVLQAIRADLGNSNWGLSRGDVVKVYLKNPREVDV
tara:strand:- start:2766 stop:3353 length:588 start_codon:yes stop_codon:yes gene_type:complete